MSKSNIYGIVIIMAILIVYGIWMSPSSEELEARKIQDSIAASNVKESAEKSFNEAIAIEESAAAEVPVESKEIITHESNDKLGIFSANTSGVEETYTLENDLLILKINSKGGFIASAELKNYKTWDQKPLMLFFDEFNEFSINFYYANKLISTSDLFFEPYYLYEYQKQGNKMTVSGNDSISFSMRMYLENPEQEKESYIEFYYGLKGDNHMIDFDIRFIGMQGIIAQNVPIININWDLVSPRQEKSYINEQRNTTIYYHYLNDEVSYLSETKDDKEDLRNNIKWISFKQQFFSISLIAKDHFKNAEVNAKMITEEENPDFIRYMNASIDMEYDVRSDNVFPMNIYLGPNHYNTLTSYDLNLERQIPLGWSFFLMSWINRYIVIPVFNWLDSMHLGYGLIILLLTIMLKIVLLPIAFKTYISSAKMRLLKPDIDEIGQKFPKKEDAMKKQQATMALYKKAGVNPMAGCIPMLLQLPILLALFRFFPASIELRQEAFLWADDLSSYDSIMDLPFNIPFYGSHVSLFTILMAISTIIYTRMNTQMMGSTNQMPGMKTMMYFMPVMLIFIFNGFASGLSYYYFLANVITFGQMFLFRYFINEDALRAKIEDKKKRPVKPSKWQEKMKQLAEAQKKRKK
jgi:YidC/Oxa1 family membrane protein insertase